MAYLANRLAEAELPFCRRYVGLEQPVCMRIKGRSFSTEEDRLLCYHTVVFLRTIPKKFPTKVSIDVSPPHA